MKTIIPRIAWIILFLVITSFSLLKAQDNIIDDLQKDKSGQGKVKIKSDPEITSMIGKPGNIETSGDKQYIKLQGYRINVFSGNNPRQSKEEALSKERQIKSSYPELSTYVTYAAPIWRLRVGDFETNEEAMLFMNKLKADFPGFGKELYVVSDEIKLLVTN